MRNHLIVFSALILLCTLSYCKKEYSKENGAQAQGSLLTNANGDCEPIVSSGHFITTRPLSDSNQLEVSVNVSTAGFFTILSDTINGYSFSASGSFAKTGVQTVRLQGRGVPAASGLDLFSIYFDSSVCTTLITVTASPVTTNIPDSARYTLQANTDSCTSASLAGTYVKDLALDASAIATVTVNVISVGAYSMSTNKVNGYQFSGSGVFTKTGVQTVSLGGSGKPLATGVDIFEVRASSSQCSFKVPVLVPLGSTLPDHFPLTIGSTWHYTSPDDSLRRRVTDTVTVAGNTYKLMTTSGKYSGKGQAFFRKSGQDYFQYMAIDSFTNSFVYIPKVYAELNFLKEGLTTGTRWTSPEYSGISSFGQKIFLQYNFYCIDANATVTIGSNAFAQVYKIEMRPEIRSEFAGYGSTTEVYTIYYAKGVGLIYIYKTLNNFPAYSFAVDNWQVF